METKFQRIPQKNEPTDLRNAVLPDTIAESRINNIRQSMEQLEKSGMTQDGGYAAFFDAEGNLTRISLAGRSDSPQPPTIEGSKSTEHPRGSSAESLPASPVSTNPSSNPSPSTDQQLAEACGLSVFTTWEELARKKRDGELLGPEEERVCNEIANKVRDEFRALADEFLAGRLAPNLQTPRLREAIVDMMDAQLEAEYEGLDLSARFYQTDFDRSGMETLLERAVQRELAFLHEENQERIDSGKRPLRLPESEDPLAVARARIRFGNVSMRETVKTDVI